MVKYRLGPTAALDARFVVSPLSETAMSLRTLVEPARFPLQAPWVSATRSALRHVDVELLRELPNARNHWPDFLQPATARAEPSIEDELAALRATPRRRIDADLRAVHGMTPPRFASSGAADEIADALQTYWQRCVRPHWPRIKTVLDADVAYRARRLARTGLRRTLSDLSPTIRIDGQTIEIESRYGTNDERDIPRGGITLVPTLFSARAAFPARAGSPLVISYGARGQAHMWVHRPPVDPDAVSALLGSARATLLRLLNEPRSSTDLAAELGVTTSAVNQHLRVMHASGLLAADRFGRHVLYRRSATGDALVS